METQNNEVVVFVKESIEIFRNAPTILKQNKERSAKAVIVGNSILDQWHEAWEIEDEEERLKAWAAADERSNKYLANCSKVLAEEKEVRAAITQMMDEFKKMFTSAENDIDKSKANSIPQKVQSNRDTYAAEAFKIQERKKKELALVAAKSKEAIEIKSQMEINVNEQYNAFLLKKKQEMTNTFNKISLENFPQREASLKAFIPKFVFQLEGPYCTINQYHNDADLIRFANETINKTLADFKANYMAEMNLFKDELIEKLPSKKAELLEEKRLADEAEEIEKANQIKEKQRQEELAKTNKENREKLEKLQKEQREKEEKEQEEIKNQRDKVASEKLLRENEEKEKLEREALEAKNKATQATEIKKQGEQTMNLFEQEAALAEIAPSPESRQGYEIVVLHPVGYTQIFQLWFENEGRNLPVDKIGNTKMDQMKSWCEKFALQKGTKIESKFVKYEDSFKAVNRKTK